MTDKQKKQVQIPSLEQIEADRTAGKVLRVWSLDRITGF